MCRYGSLIKTNPFGSCLTCNIFSTSLSPLRACVFSLEKVLRLTPIKKKQSKAKPNNSAIATTIAPQCFWKQKKLERIKTNWTKVWTWTVEISWLNLTYFSHDGNFNLLLLISCKFSYLIENLVNVFFKFSSKQKRICQIIVWPKSAKIWSFAWLPDFVISRTA